MKLRVLALVFATLSMPTTVSAGIHTDDLSRCLVKSSTAQDQTTLMRWLFAAFSASPSVSSMSSVTTDQRKALNAESAALMQRLILKDCRAEAMQAAKYEGPRSSKRASGFLAR